MLKPAKPDNEAARLRALHRYQILDTAAEAAFDDLVAIAAAICGTPMGSVTLVDADRQWLKARIGLEGTETTRDTAFCAHTILDRAVLVVGDALRDARFCENPYVLGDPHIRFYAGAPIVTLEGLAMGALCVMDSEPRDLAPFQVNALDALSRQVSSLLELRRVTRDLKFQLQDREWYEDQLQQFQASLEAHNADLTEQVKLDALTGLGNRRLFAAALEAAVEADLPCSVAVIDIDHFKAINDTHGHQAGDEVLVDVATALRATSSGRGTLARYGGEEFAWLLPGVGLAQARTECDYLREAIAHASQALPVTVSIGVVERRPGEAATPMFRRADEALYAAKRGGRDRVVAA